MSLLRFRFWLPLVCMILLVCATPRTQTRKQIQPHRLVTPLQSNSLRNVINDYAKSVDSLDLSLARKVWSNAPEVTFIHPRGTERGLDHVLHNFYENTMGTFSKRQLLPDKIDIHMYDDTAWSEFTWTFHATFKANGQDITTQGRETQVYHKENGNWRVVHVHYSGLPVSGELRGF